MTHRVQRKAIRSLPHVLALVGLLLATGLQAQQAASPAPCSAAENEQFDFWVGEWVVTGPDGTGTGSSKVEKILQGCVLQENWSGAAGTNGKSFNMFDRASGHWRQTWVDNGGSRLDLEGGWSDGRMVLSGKKKRPDGSVILHEISWTPKDDGTVVQHWRASKNRGREWNDLFIGVYHPAS